MNYCCYCGTSLAKNAKYCYSCGKIIQIKKEESKYREEIIVGKIKNSENRGIIIRILAFKNDSNYYLDIRKYYKDMKTKGLSFNIKWFDLFMSIIEQISCKNNILYLSDKYINLLNYRKNTFIGDSEYSIVCFDHFDIDEDKEIRVSYVKGDNNERYIDIRKYNLRGNRFLQGLFISVDDYEELKKVCSNVRNYI